MKKLLLALVVLILAGAAGAYLWADRHPALAAITPPDPDSLDPALVKEGEILAGLGNCAVCHTREGGRAMEGGLALPTPFGVIYTSNLTPDVETGIGSWSEEAFIRAMRHGIDREGHYLYPAFPYDYFARASDADMGAIYAYLMSLAPISYTPPENELGFPFNQRILMAGWNLLFHDPTPWSPDPAQDEEWNRGAYLVEGLGHCGACHSARNMLGVAAKTGAGAYAGGLAEGWTVPALNADSTAPVPWTQDTLVNYLIDGFDPDHGIAGGPMRAVSDDLYEQDEDESFAIAAYVVSLMGGEPDRDEVEARAAAAREAAERLEWGHADGPAQPEDPALAAGAAVFERECASCHKAGGEAAPLALGSVVRAPSADNLVLTVFQGVQPPRGVPGRSMPARPLQISDTEMEALAGYMRARFTELPPWKDIAGSVKAARAALAAH